MMSLLAATATFAKEPTLSLLEVDRISVRFGGLLAVQSASLTVDAGTITGLIGPNGAGKTTLFNVITGLQSPTNGDIVFDGRNVTRQGVHKRARLGIARTFQKLEAFNSLSARDNVLVAAEMASRSRRGGRSVKTISDDALEQVGLSDLADVTVGTMPTATARLVELARALATGPKILLLDEASSGLNDEETEVVGALLARLVAESGVSVLLVEHDMSFVMGLCSQLYVLDLGQVIASGTAAQVQADQRVQTAYLGTAAPVSPA
jgi:branched-chain amino acid transport system ATP-binding protein